MKHIKLFGMASFLLLLFSCDDGHLAHADDPMNKPLASVGVKGYDTSLCNDQWNECTRYDREQFDSKYPGTSLDSISLYPLAKRRGGASSSSSSQYAEDTHEQEHTSTRDGSSFGEER